MRKYSIKPDLLKRAGPMLMSGVNERLKKQSPKKHGTTPVFRNVECAVLVAAVSGLWVYI